MIRDNDQTDVDAVTDAVIDDVAREMTSAPAEDGFARRVSARIEAGGASRAWPRMWLLAPAAAACVLALVVFVAREHPEPAPAQTVQTNPEAGREIAPNPRTGAAPAVTAITGAAPGTEPRAARAAAGTRPAAAPPASPALEAPAPIVLEPINVSPLVVAMPIEISTIAIDRIEIPAMP